MSIASVSRFVIRQAIGLAITGAAFYVGWIALHAKPIEVDLVKVAGVGVLLGGLVIDPDPIAAALKQLVALIPVSLVSHWSDPVSPPALTETQIAEESKGD